MAAMQLTRTHRILIAVVVAGAVIIAGIGFTGSYAAVRELAEKKGFGSFSTVFPIGIDAGICVLLALDLLLTWIRIPFPLLRQAAWLLTAATIAFNGAAAWPDPLGTGMHAVIPILFVVCVEAARHAVGRIADITADKHMEGVRLTRWLLSPIPTFRLWRRMKLWELRRYDEVIRLEQDRLIYQARLQARFGRGWRRKAPIESLMPLRLAKYGVPLSETAPSGLAAAGIEPVLLPPAPALEAAPATVGAVAAVAPAPAALATGPAAPPQEQTQGQEQEQAQQYEQHEQQQPQDQDQTEHAEQQAPHENPWFAPQISQEAYAGSYDPTYEPTYEQQYEREQQYAQELYAQEQYEQGRYEQDRYAEQHDPQYPADPQDGPHPDEAAQDHEAADGPAPVERPVRSRPLGGTLPGPRPEQQPEALSDPVGPETAGLPEDVSREDAYFTAFRKYISENNESPTPRQFGRYLKDLYGVTGRNGDTLSDSSMRAYINRFQIRYNNELDAEHIA